MGLFSQIMSRQSSPVIETMRGDSCSTGCGTADFPEWYGAGRVGLTREEIDDLCVSEFMTRIVTTMVKDACRVAPSLSGPTLGQLDDVWDYMEGRHFSSEEETTHIYSWKYGGGALVINAADGGRWEDPILLERVESINGFFPIERSYITPGPASPNGAGGWWGPTWGRPSYYQVNPYTPGDARAPNQIAGGTVIHPSRVIPLPYRRDLNLRQARRYAHWNGWGPGIVEGVLEAFEARGQGMRRVGDIMSSFGYDFMQVKGLQEMLSAPDGKNRLRTFIQNLKRCRDMSGDGVPVVVTGPEVDKITSVSRTVSGLSDLVETQREYLLDCTPYTRVVLFGETKAGLGSGSAGGEWQTHFQAVSNYQESVRWRAIRHAAIVAMAAKDGPTGGKVDFGIVAAWESLEQEKESDKSENRKRNAEAREKDSLVLGISAQTLALYDPTIDDTYPGLAAAVENGTVSLDGPAPSPAAPVAMPGGTGGPAPSTPESAEEGPQLGESIATDSIPTDLVSEPEARKLLRCGVRSFLRKVESGDLTPWQLGRSRTYSLAELTKVARGDSYRGDPYPNEHAARQIHLKGLTDFKRLSIAPGVALIQAKKGNKTIVASVRLSAEEFSPDEAREWLAVHGYEQAAFEAATGGRTDRMDSADVGARLDACACDGDDLAFADVYDAACSGDEWSTMDGSDEDRIAEAYKRYHEEVNMGPAKLRAWAKNPCSSKASLSREPINRNLRILETPREEWTLATAKSAMRTVSFVSRMKGAEQGKPAAKGCPSKRDISLRNWAFWP